MCSGSVDITGKYKDIKFLTSISGMPFGIEKMSITIASHISRDGRISLHITLGAIYLPEKLCHLGMGCHLG